MDKVEAFLRLIFDDTKNKFILTDKQSIERVVHTFRGWNDVHVIVMDHQQASHDGCITFQQLMMEDSSTPDDSDCRPK